MAKNGAQQQVEKIQEQVNGVVSDVQDKAKETLNSAQEKTKDALHDAQDKAKSVYSDVKSEAQAKVEQVTEKLPVKSGPAPYQIVLVLLALIAVIGFVWYRNQEA